MGRFRVSALWPDQAGQHSLHGRTGAPAGRHGGVTATHFNRNNGVLMRIGMALSRPFARSAAKGAETLVWLVDSEAAGDTSGGYFFDEHPVTPSAAAQDGGAGARA